MRWYHDLAYFFGGAFLANAVPHYVNGIPGTRSKVRSRIHRAKGCPPRS
ncbi:hypothetical protein [Anaeromyxobacter oryzisoli]|nr:hypothetical protein [Anaeromyxobacter sp. SG63]